MPQHAKRVKIRRKDLQQPDEFETLTGEALDWARRHQALLAGVAAAVVAVALVVLLIARMRASAAEVAALDFRAAHTLFAGGKYGEAADAFATLADASPRTPFGRLAGLYRGHALFRKGDPAAAATAYGEYLASSPATSYLQQEALTGQARAQEAAGNPSAALESFTQAGALEGPYRTDALLGAARLESAAGHADEARRLYTQLLNDSPEPELKAFILAQIPGAAAPVASEKSPGAGENPADAEDAPNVR